MQADAPVIIIDGANRNLRPGGQTLWSYFDIPGTPPRYDEYQDVPHGAYNYRMHRSMLMKVFPNGVVYTPPEYDRFPNRKFPGWLNEWKPIPIG